MDNEIILRNTENNVFWKQICLAAKK